MDTLNLIPAEHVAAARTTLRPPIVEIEQPHTEPVGSAVVDGLNWTFRGGFEQVLANVSSVVWKNPASQGWKLVKSNSSREVWRASIQGATYYVKYYHCSSWQARIKRLLRGPVCLKEWRGGIFAIEQGIPAVRPAGYVGDISCNGRPASILVTEAVEAAQPLDEFWRLLQTDRDVRRRRGDTRILIDRLAALIAGSHQAGFEHLDMHPANILVQTVGPRRYRTVFVDLQSARLGVPIDDVAVVRNLTQLNQWFRRNSTTADRLRFLRAYVRWRNEHETAHAQGRPLSLSFDQLVRAMERRAAVHAALIWRQRDRRVARNGRYFARIKLPGGWTGMAAVQSKRPQEGSGASARVLDRAWWKEQLRDPLRWLDPKRQLAKDSHSATVAIVALPHPDGEVRSIVKRPIARDPQRALRRLFPPSRSWRGWTIGHGLLHRDLPAARPLAILERTLGPFVRDNLLLTEFVPDAQPLDEYLRAQARISRPHDWFAAKRELIRIVVRELRRLQERGFLHRDCKASNILIASRPAPRLVWIDMDGIRPDRRRNEQDRLRPLMRLQVSLSELPEITRTDRARFLKAYCARFGARTDEWRRCWRVLAELSTRKLEQRERRREWKREHYGRE